MKKTIVYAVTASVIIVALSCYFSEYLQRRDKVERLVVAYQDYVFISNTQVYWNSCGKGKRLVANNLAYNGGAQPLGSWRLASLYNLQGIEQSGVPQDEWRFDYLKSWNDPSNKSFHVRYYSWEDNPKSSVYNHTNVMAITGKGTAMERWQTATTSEALSGLEETIILIEVGGDSKIHWGEPGDFEVDKITYEDVFPEGVQEIMVVFGDGEIWRVKDTVPFNVFKKFLTVNDNEWRDRRKELLPYSKIAYRRNSK